MAIYTPDELDMLRYAEEAGDILTDEYYPKEIRRPAYDTMLALSKLVLVIKKQPNPAETWPEYGETIDRLSEAAIDVAVVIFRNLPMSSMGLMEHENRLANSKRHERYYESRSKERKIHEGELLTQTENELARYLYRGLSPTEIAETTGRKRTNITSHLQNAYKKLGASGSNSREVAVKRLFELGVFKDEGPIHSELFTLTPRQKAVMKLVMDGVGRNESAEKLGIGSETVQKEIKNIQKSLGLETSHAAVRAVLEAGGLDAIKLEDKTELFLTDIETPKNYGMYVRWLEEIFLSNPDTPFSLEDLAKILYGEQYSKANRRLIMPKTNQLLYGAMRERGKNATLLRPRLMEAGLNFSRIDYPKQKMQSSIRYISHKADLRSVESYMGKELTEAEIKQLALKLRQEENARQRSEPKSIDINEPTTWAEGEVIEAAIQNQLREEVRPTSY